MTRYPCSRCGDRPAVSATLGLCELCAYADAVSPDAAERARQAAEAAKQAAKAAKTKAKR